LPNGAEIKNFGVIFFYFVSVPQQPSTST